MSLKKHCTDPEHENKEFVPASKIFWEHLRIVKEHLRTSSNIWPKTWKQAIFASWRTSSNIWEHLENILEHLRISREHLTQDMGTRNLCLLKNILEHLRITREHLAHYTGTSNLCLLKNILNHLGISREHLRSSDPGHGNTQFVPLKEHPRTSENN